MVSFINNGQTNIYFCIATDESPAGAPNGSALYEMDTGAIYLYDEENETWINQADGSSRGDDDDEQVPT